MQMKKKSFCLATQSNVFLNGTQVAMIEREIIVAIRDAFRKFLENEKIVLCDRRRTYSISWSVKIDEISRGLYILPVIRFLPFRFSA